MNDLTNNENLTNNKSTFQNSIMPFDQNKTIPKTKNTDNKKKQENKK